jgi:hypothetical protein
MKTVNGDQNRQVEFSHALPNGIYLISITFQSPLRDMTFRRYLSS